MAEEVKEEKLGPAPKEEVKVWGLGLTNNKLDRLIELQDRTNFLLACLEKKIEKLISS